MIVSYMNRFQSHVLYIIKVNICLLKPTVLGYTHGIDRNGGRFKRVKIRSCPP